MERRNDMIDTHAHILPGLDDGARSLSESVDMAKSAVLCGIRTIIATPHKIKGSYDISIDDVKRKVVGLNRELKKENVPVRIIFGGENYADFNIDPRFTINNKNYFLLEFPMQSYPPFCDEIVDDLIGRGVIPIVSCVEHNHDILHNPSIIEELVNKGCLMQLTSTALTSRHKSTRDFAVFLLKNNVYHLFASNAHDPEEYKMFSKALKILKGYVGEEKTAEMTCTIPRQILSGERYSPAKIKFNKRRTMFGFRAFVRRMLP